MSVEFDRGSPGKLDSRTLSREALSRWTGHIRFHQGRIAVIFWSYVPHVLPDVVLIAHMLPHVSVVCFNIANTKEHGSNEQRQ